MSAPSRPTLTERRADELRMTIALAARELFLADGSFLWWSSRSGHRHLWLHRAGAEPLHQGVRANPSLSFHHDVSVYQNRGSEDIDLRPCPRHPIDVRIAATPSRPQSGAFARCSRVLA